MENTQTSERIIFYLENGEPRLRAKIKKIPQKLEKPLKAVSMLKKHLWETEIALFGARKGELLFPEQIGEEKVRKILREMKGKRLKWLLWLSLVFPLTFLLTPIPGPNVAYFYVLGRLILHFKSVKGIKQVLKEYQFIPVKNLEEYVRELDSEGNYVKI